MYGTSATQLHFAKAMIITQSLISHGADVNVLDTKDTRLHYLEKFDVVELLFEGDADVNVWDVDQF